MQIGRKMTDLEAFEVLSVILEHPVYILSNFFRIKSLQVIKEKLF